MEIDAPDFTAVQKNGFDDAMEDFYPQFNGWVEFNQGSSYTVKSPACLICQIFYCSIELPRGWDRQTQIIIAGYMIENSSPNFKLIFFCQQDKAFSERSWFMTSPCLSVRPNHYCTSPKWRGFGAAPLHEATATEDHLDLSSADASSLI